MKFYLALIGCIFLLSCSKDESAKLGDNPTEDIVGTWYLVGYDTGGFVPSARKKWYDITDDHTYTYYGGLNPQNGVYSIENGNTIYLDGSSGRKFFFSNERLYIEYLIIDPSGKVKEVLEK